MKKIFKKSLALVLSAALCLTALVGCLTVSAETATPTYKIVSTEGTAGATVTVTAELTNLDDVCAHLIDIVYPSDLELGTVTDSLGNTYLSISAWEAAGKDSEKPYYNIIDGEGVKHIRFCEFVNWPTGEDKISTSNMKFYIEFAIPEGAAAGTEYTITPTVQAGAYKDDSALLDVTLTEGKITVKAATTEPVEITDNLLIHNLYLMASVGSSIAVNVSANGGLKTIGYSDYYLKIEYKKYGKGYVLEDAEPIVLLPEQRSEQNKAKTVDYFYFTSLALYEMPLEYTVTLYLKDETGNTVAFKRDRTSVVAQALAYANKYNTNTTLLRTLVDMVNYGDAVQNFFAKDNPSSDIVTAVSPKIGFESYQQYASTAADLPSSFNTDKKLIKDVSTSTLNANATVVIDASNYISYTFLANNYDQSKLVAEVEYVDSYGTTQKSTVKFTDMERKESATTGNVTYSFVFKNLAIYDLEKTVTVKLLNDGIQEASYIYSVGNFVNSYITNTKFNDVLTKMELFSQSARIQMTGK